MKEKRESKHVAVARVIYGQAKAVFPQYSHRFSPKKFTLPQLASCVLLSFYFKMSYRDFEELLVMSEELRKALGLVEAPDHSTMNRMYHKFRASHLDRMNEELLKGMKIEEETMTMDSTGYRPTNASAYFQTRRGKTFKHWKKGAYAVGIRSQMILAMAHGLGPSSDAPHLSTLKRRAAKFGKRDEKNHPIWLCLADSGFDSVSIGSRDLIPPIRRGGSLKDPVRIARAELVSQARLDGLFGYRWLIETVNSVIKRKFGDAIRSFKPASQNRESRVKAFIYNAYR